MKRPLPASGRLGRIFLNTPACAPARCAKTAGQSRIIAVRNVAYRLGKGILAIRRLPTSMERTRLVVVRAPGKRLRDLPLAIDKCVEPLALPPFLFVKFATPLKPLPRNFYAQPSHL